MSEYLLPLIIKRTTEKLFRFMLVRVWVCIKYEWEQEKINMANNDKNVLNVLWEWMWVCDKQEKYFK